MRLDLKAIRHNLFHFNDRLGRIYCDECDEGVDYQEVDSMQEEDASQEEVRAEIFKRNRASSAQIIGKGTFIVYQCNPKLLIAF